MEDWCMYTFTNLREDSVGVVDSFDHNKKEREFITFLFGIGEIVLLHMCRRRKRISSAVIPLVEISKDFYYTTRMFGHELCPSL